MNIVESYSYFNGLEYLKVRKARLWEEINKAISSVDANNCKIKFFFDKDKARFSSVALYASLKKVLTGMGWEDNWVLKRGKLTKNLLSKLSEEKTDEIKEKDIRTLADQNIIEFVKERVAVGIYFDNYHLESPVLFARHLTSYIYDMIDVGVEILPMKALQTQMSSGVPYYEGELYNVIRQGRGVPAVPLVIVGIMP